MTIKYAATGQQRWRASAANDVAGVYAGAIAFCGPSAVVVGAATWNGNAEGSDALFLKYRARNGVRMWKRTMGNGEAFDESIADLGTDTAGDLVAAGTTHDENFDRTHGYMAGLSAAGADGWTNEFWVDPRPMTPHSSRYPWPQAVAPAPAAGPRPCSPAWTSRSAMSPASGPAFSWDRTLGGTAIGDDVCRDVLLAPGVYAAGQLYNAGTGTDAVLLKL